MKRTIFITAIIAFLLFAAIVLLAVTAVRFEVDWLSAGLVAAVIIGGTSLLGGVGKVWGTMVGVIFLGVIINGMTLLNVSEYWQHVVRGVLILAAVFINRLQQREP